jgi:hypothetical protein
MQQEGRRPNGSPMQAFEVTDIMLSGALLRSLKKTYLIIASSSTENFMSDKTNLWMSSNLHTLGVPR